MLIFIKQPSVSLLWKPYFFRDRERESEARLDVYIGRQPLYDKQYTLYGYDILHRDNLTNTAQVFEDDDTALLNLFSNAFGMCDMDALTDGLPAHFPFTRELLFTGLPYTASPRRMVVKLSADISVDAALTDKLNELKIAGYRLALSGYNIRNSVKLNKILHLFDFIYINVYHHNHLQLQEVMSKIRANTVGKVVAEQVDMESDFDEAKNLNFSMFQGILFGKPDVLKTEVSLAVTPYGKLYNELSRSGSSFDSCCKFFSAEPLLTHMFLQETPSPRKKVDLPDEVRRVMMSIGLEQLRKWSCLLMVKHLNAGDTALLPRRAYRRAAFLEKLVEAGGVKAEASLAFYLGIFSLLGEITETPLETVFNQLRLEPEVKNALLGKEQNVYAALLRCAEQYEETEAPAEVPGLKLKLDERKLAQLYKLSGEETEAAFYTTNPFKSNKSGHLQVGRRR